MKEADDGKGLDELIAALQIFRKYGNPLYPTHCEHDVLTICYIEPSEVSKDDIVKLGTMGFFLSGEDVTDDEVVAEDAEYFQSFRYGSA